MLMRNRMKGKNYANRKPESERPLNDFYPTPSCMIEKICEDGYFNYPKGVKIYDPCCGKYVIGNVLRKFGYNNITENDIMYGNDFLKEKIEKKYDVIIMNPPFKLFDEFVKKALESATDVWCIGKLNFFGAHNRNVSGLWNKLSWVFPFDRMIAFDKPETEDGKVECGMMVTGWFVWEENPSYDFPAIEVLDMQKYIRKSSK